MVTRKNVKSLTGAEKAQFVNAVKALKANGRYNQYVRRHAQAMMDAIHRCPAFLPWHRQFILDFERDLQQVSGNPNLALPYWNWAEDAARPDPRTAPVWADDLMGGNGDPNDNWIVKRGPFRQGEWTIITETGSPAGALRRHQGLEFPPPTFRPRPISLPSQTDLNNALNTTPYDASPWNMNSNPSFRNRLEGWYGAVGPGLHNRGHVWVGGSMLPMTSPNDPIFFLHHCFVDKIWSDWQIRFPTQNYLPASGGPRGQNLNDLMERTVSGSVTPASVLKTAPLGYRYDTDPVARLAQVMWVHAHNLQIEFADRLQTVWRTAFYTRTDGKPNTDNWFHFAIPTPVVVNDGRLRVSAATLRFRTSSDLAFIRAVHIYDGETRIAAHDNLRLSPRNWTTQQFDVPGDPAVRWGIGLSIGVRFGGATALENRLEFSAAGCDFLP